MFRQMDFFEIVRSERRSALFGIMTLDKRSPRTPITVCCARNPVWPPTSVSPRGDLPHDHWYRLFSNLPWIGIGRIKTQGENLVEKKAFLSLRLLRTQQSPLGAVLGKPFEFLMPTSCWTKAAHRPRGWAPTTRSPWTPRSAMPSKNGVTRCGAFLRHAGRSWATRNTGFPTWGHKGYWDDGVVTPREFLALSVDAWPSKTSAAGAFPKFLWGIRILRQHQRQDGSNFPALFGLGPGHDVGGLEQLFEQRRDSKAVLEPFPDPGPIPATRDEVFKI